MKLKKGDVVRLKSGGPDMTVDEVGECAMIGGQGVWRLWFEYSGRQQVLKRETFPPETLEQSGDTAPIAGRVVRGQRE